MYTPQETTQILLYRQKLLAGTITKEELQAGLDLLRKARSTAHATSAASRRKKAAAKAPVDSDKMLGELDGLAGL